MMMSRNYYSKVDNEVSCGLPDVRIMMTRNYYSKVDNKVSCGYCGMFA
jgi:hypothetical protein